MKGDSIAGEAQFKYHLDGDDTIFDGSFDYQRVTLNPKKPELKEVLSVELSGKFLNGRKNGSWVYFNKKLVPGDSLRVSDYDVAYPADGNSLLIDARFKDGMPSGEWRFLKKTIFRGKPSDTLSFGKITFENALIHGEMLLATGDTLLKGSFDKGVLDDDWSFFIVNDSVDVEAVRVYEDGWLRSHTLTFNNETYTFEHRHHLRRDANAVVDTLYVNKLYFDILELSLKLTDKYLASSDDAVQNIETYSNLNSSYFLNTHSTFFKDNGFNVWNAMIQSFTEFNLGEVYVNKYPFTDSLRDTINWMAHAIDSAGQEIKGLFDNPFVEIGRFSYKEIAFIFSEFSFYDSLFFDYQSIKDLLLNPAIEYFPLDSVFSRHLPTIYCPDSLKYSFNDSNQCKAFPLTKPLTDTNKTFDALVLHINEFYDRILTISERSKDLLDVVRKESALSELEAEMVKSKDSVVRLFKGESGDFNDHHKDVSSGVLSFTDGTFKSYMRLDVEQKKDVIDERIACFKDLMSLYDMVATLPRKFKRLDDEYTRTVWNAYLMVDMDERVKDRLYNAVIDYAFPYLLNRLKTDLECGEIKKASSDIQNVYDRMIELRERDTRDLEKVLRRERDPEVVLNAIGIEISK